MPFQHAAGLDPLNPLVHRALGSVLYATRRYAESLVPLRRALALNPQLANAQAAIGREVATSLIKFVNAGATTSAVNFPQVEVPPAPGAHRILNMHRNVPGVLRDINRIVSDRNANIRAQVLATDASVGYVVIDLDQDVSDDVKGDISKLQASIRTRILY